MTSELDDAALDWLRKSDDQNTRALRAYVLEMFDKAQAENKRLRSLARDILDAWRSGENPKDYDKTVNEAVELFGGRK